MFSFAAMFIVIALCVVALCNGNVNTPESPRERCLREAISSISACFRGSNFTDILRVGFVNNPQCEPLSKNLVDTPEKDNSPAAIRGRWYRCPGQPNLGQYCDETKNDSATYETYNSMQECLKNMINLTGDCRDLYKETTASMSKDVYNDLCADPGKYAQLGKCFYENPLDWPNDYLVMANSSGCPEMYDVCMGVTSQRGRIQTQCPASLQAFDASVVPLFQVNPLCKEYVGLLKKRSSAAPSVCPVTFFMFLSAFGALKQIFMQE